jgi:o-succinylbenzoate synthase
MTQIKKIKLFTYTNTFSTIGKKQSIIIKFSDEANRSSYGEISPLPSRSHESILNAKDELFTLCKCLLSNQATPFNLSPSVMFGVASALLELQSSTRRPSHKKRDLLITSSSKPNLKTFGELLKVKIKGMSLEKAIDLCKYLSDQGKTFCVDCNQAFTLQEMLYFSKHFTKGQIEYLEEPISPFTDLLKFTNACSMPIAIDESLYMQPIERILTLKTLKLIILKPTLIGGYNELQAIMEKCGSTPCTLSSSYEGAIGINNIITLASYLNIKQPLGIDTQRYATNCILNDSETFSVNEELLCPLILQ